MPLYLLPLGVMMRKVQVLGCFVGLKAFICIRVVLFKTFSCILQATVDHELCKGMWKDVKRISVVFWLSSPIQNSFKPRDREGSVAHSYVTEDLSKCSFRLSAGGGPWHLARVDCRGGLSWSPQIIRTMEQMTADKLQRVEWPEKGGDEAAAASDPLITFIVERRMFVNGTWGVVGLSFYIFTNRHKRFYHWFNLKVDVPTAHWLNSEQFWRTTRRVKNSFSCFETQV